MNYIDLKDSNIEVLAKNFDAFCSDTTLGKEWSFHQLSPYIGKIKSSIANFLIENFTSKGDTIYDPFCGAGTIPFEGWVLGRKVIANDLNKYALILTKAKLFPPKDKESLIRLVEKLSLMVDAKKKNIDLRKVPLWVRNFFHKETLRELIVWFEILEGNEYYFLLACLLGILHHQRPGFLSFPSSHTVPYLRASKFPRNKFPELYQYRSIKDRLIKKIGRAYKKLPVLNDKIERLCYNEDASKLQLNKKFDAIISSPPYMRQLDYARDNRLRLWFLNVENCKELDIKISPKESDFIGMMTECLLHWKKNLKTNGKCILFLGDNYSKKYKLKLPEIIERIATKEICGYKLIFKHQSLIPNNRRVRRTYSGNKIETVLVFQKDGK